MNFEKGNLEQPKRNRSSSWGKLLLGIFVVTVLGSCSVTEHLGPNEYLLKSSVSFEKVKPEAEELAGKKIRLTGLRELGLSTIDESVLYSSVRTRPNKRMIIPKTYLHFYMLGKSLQTPLDSLMPPTRAGRTQNGKLWNDFKVLSQSPQKLLASIKYLDQRLLKGNFIDSLGSFLENTAGEPPRILDLDQLRLDQENLVQVYFSQGFFYASDTFEIDTLRKFSLLRSGGREETKKVKVKFLIREGKAAVIDRYEIDSVLITNQFIYNRLQLTKDKSLLKPGDLYVERNIVAERSRIVDQMRNSGWYSFNPQMVFFNVDTLPDSVSGKLPNNPAIKNYSSVVVKIRIPAEVAQVHLGKITLNVDAAEFDPEQDTLLQIISSYLMNDSLRKVWGISRRIYSDSNSVVFFGYPRVMQKLNLNFLEQLIEQEIRVADLGKLSYREGQRFSLIVERNVQRRLQSLGIFKYVLVKHTLDGQTLNIRIEAQLLQKYQIKTGVEGFTQTDPFISRNLPGFGFEVGLRNLLVFKGAEKLDFSAAGNASFFRTGDGEDGQVFLAGNAGFNFTVPRLIIPFARKIVRGNLQAFSPFTSFKLDGTREDSRAYTRNSLTMNWNYNWINGSDGRLRNMKSSLSPYVISFVTSNLSDQFINSILNIEDRELRNLFALDFASRYSSWGRYQFTLSDYGQRKNSITSFFQGVLEMGGNTPFLIDRLGHLVQDTVNFFQAPDLGYEDGKLGNVLYGQYLKISGEARLHAPLTEKSSFVIRGFIGAAKPWNFTRNVPLTSRFFAGGVNGMRGWQSNTLGPGTYLPTLSDTTEATFGNVLNLGGEFRLEFNAEFRANVYNWIEMAIFSDIGNVWFLPGSDLGFEGQEKAILSKNNIGELGWDFGIGIRFDFDFFVFRVDFAQQLYDPSVQSFVVKSFPRDLGGGGFQTNFGIGYPF